MKPNRLNQLSMLTSFSLYSSYLPGDDDEFGDLTDMS